MGNAELMIRGGSVVAGTGVQKVDLAIADGQIQAVGPDLNGEGAPVIEATGLHIFPGVIDAHVHFNDPGRADWEGFKTGSRAVAAGGGTLFFDMPLNAHPPTLDAQSFREKLAAAERQSVVDFAFWGGLVPGNVDRLEELAECGVVGFKAFMANSGMDDFPCVDDKALRTGMARAARLRLPVAVHAESEAMLQQLAQTREVTTLLGSIRAYLASRPVAVELEAIRRALDLAGETKCALHVVHVSCGEGIRLITEARRRGLDVSCETCPHYLTLTEEDVERLGAISKCAPPLRSAETQTALWKELSAGNVTTVGSDHSPCPPAMKERDSFFEVWGGISGAQHLLPLMLTSAHHEHNLPLPLVSGLLSQNPARRFRLPESKGRVAVGADADLALVALDQPFEVQARDLFYRHAQTPYLGRRLRGRVARTILRGRTVFHDGKIVAGQRGRLIKPVQ
jgi:allantoinase